jgi:hypothetical protein
MTHTGGNGETVSEVLLDGLRFGRRFDDDEVIHSCSVLVLRIVLAGERIVTDREDLKRVGDRPESQTGTDGIPD